MASIRIEGLPVAQPEPDPWPMDDHPLSVQADEMLARQLDTEFAGEVRTFLHDPEMGLMARDPDQS
ncbi:MAG: hypothetical protein K2Y40_10345 [Reyranella sp.]|jgi:hypothetical protein|nr:hypothetical protein [Reyranella sp.]